MEDPYSKPDPSPSEATSETRQVDSEKIETEPPTELAAVSEIITAPVRVSDSGGPSESRQQSFRRNLLLLLSFSLTAFVLTAWILVRVDSPFNPFATGPQEIAQAQLRALDRGQLMPAYEMFSERYRQQVPFDAWHELIVTHWRMFHAQVLGASVPATIGPRVTLEIDLRGADDNEYRARYTLILQQGRWWIDDIHWAEEADVRDITRI